MLYQKYQADFLFTGYEILNQEYVLITDEKGVVIDIVHETEAGNDIKKLSGLLTPGFINCHCHLELSHMKGLIPEKTGLVDFVFKVVTQRHFPEEEILNAIANAEKEMLINGIVAVGDICNNTLTIPQKEKGNLYYYNFIEVSGWLPQVAIERFKRSKDFYDEFSRQSSVVNCQSLAPHAPYSVSENLWKLIEPFFQNKTTTIHNQETVFEDEFFKTGKGDFERMYNMMKIDNTFFKPSGKSSIQTILPHFKNAEKIILVHNTFIKEEDIKYINAVSNNNHQQFFYCLCVNANSYIENASPPVEMLQNLNCNIVLGTDSLASNWGLSILDEIKVIRNCFPTLTTVQLLQWATINGAKALSLNDKLGSFEKGKRPGIVLIENLTQEGNITPISASTTVKNAL
ncbi:MAG: amidohydrolase family protein [Bacteroidetes bacterium]|nr:amidohydrolase family protein [Bacteroidota bacterium]MBS1669875.1 amidohydrolase family protein [Bacteroidota bacterium]